MKKLIKPLMSVEDYTDEVVQAFCDHDNCSGNCKDYNMGCSGACRSIGDVELDEDILF